MGVASSGTLFVLPGSAFLRRRNLGPDNSTDRDHYLQVEGDGLERISPPVGESEAPPLEHTRASVFKHKS